MTPRCSLINRENTVADATPIAQAGPVGWATRYLGLTPALYQQCENLLKECKWSLSDGMGGMVAMCHAANR